MNFIQYLNESSMKKTSIRQEDLLDFLEKNCRNALDGYKLGNVIYRGANYYGSPYVHIDNSNTTRRSINTLNYYTIILDTILSKMDLPLRSKSTICTNSKFTAESFGNKLYAVFPFDNCQFGFINEGDIYEISIGVGVLQYKQELALHILNNSYKSSRLSDKSFDDFCIGILRLISKIPDPNLPLKDLMEYLDSEYWTELPLILSEIIIHYGKDIEAVKKYFMDKYNPFELGFSFTTNPYHGFPSKDTEIWFTGNYVLIDLEYIDEVL